MLVSVAEHSDGTCAVPTGTGSNASITVSDGESSIELAKDVALDFAEAGSCTLLRRVFVGKVITRRPIT